MAQTGTYLPNFSSLTFGNADNFFSFPGGAMHAKVWGYHHHVIFKTPKTRVWVKERCSEENGAASSFMRIGFFVLTETDIFNQWVNSKSRFFGSFLKGLLLAIKGFIFISSKEGS